MGLIVPPELGFDKAREGAGGGSSLVKPGDPFFTELSNELGDKGFLVTTTDDLINWARTGSLMWMTFGLACCAVEMMQASMPRYDLERFGIKVVGSPRHADLLLISGPVTRKMAPRLKRVYEQMPEPKIVVCVGTCGTSGGAFYDSYTLVGPVDQVVPVDMYVPGCPPRPEAIIDGVVKVLARLEAKENAAS